MTDERYRHSIRQNSLKWQFDCHIALRVIINHKLCKIRIKQDLSYISICSLGILYNGKFILMATSLGTHSVVVTRVHNRYMINLYCLALQAGIYSDASVGFDPEAALVIRNVSLVKLIFFYISRYLCM